MTYTGNSHTKIQIINTWGKKANPKRNPRMTMKYHYSSTELTII